MAAILAILMFLTIAGLPGKTEAAEKVTIKTLNPNTWASKEWYDYNSSTNKWEYTVYKITVKEAGELKFTTSGTTLVSLYDTKADATNTDLSAKTQGSEELVSDSDKQKSYAVDKGTYYLKVSWGKVKYSFNKAVNKTNYSMAKAVALKSGTTVKIIQSPRMNYCRWYKISNPKKHQIKYWVNTASNGYNVELYNSKGKLLQTVKDDSDTRYCSAVAQKAGTYYLCVKTDSITYLTDSYAFGNVITLKWK